MECTIIGVSFSIQKILTCLIWSHHYLSWSKTVCHHWTDFGDSSGISRWILIVTFWLAAVLGWLAAGPKHSIHTYSYTDTRTHARTHTHALTRTHARKHTPNTRTHARTHAHTHTHTHTPLSMPCNGAVVHTWHATVTMPHAVLLLFSDRDYKRQTGYVVSHDNLLIYMDGGEYVQWIFFFQFISQICRIVYSSERRLKWRKNELMNNTSTRTRVLPCKLKYRLKIKYIQNGTICLLNSFFFSSSLSQFYSA